MTDCCFQNNTPIFITKRNSMAILVLVRHGQSTYNLQNRFTGNLDVPLTALGKAEAKIAGDKLMAYSFDHAYDSTLMRAQESLRIILVQIDQTNIPIIHEAALNERMYGNLQGLNKAETMAKFGDEQVDIWRRSYKVRPPEGESLEDTYNRAVPYYMREMEPKLRAGKNILVVAHGNSLRALKMHLENISESEIVNVNMPTGIPILYEFDRNMKTITVKYL